MGDIFRLEKNWEKADKCYVEAQKLLSSLGPEQDKYIEGVLFLSRAYANQMQQHYSAANDFYARALPLIEVKLALQPDLLQQTLNSYAYTAWQAGDYFKAIQVHKRAEALTVWTAPKSK